ncbi:MAG: PAS domain-containing protein, partial [Oscillospiraceae bacterium]
MKKFSEIRADCAQLSLPIGLMIVTPYPEYQIRFANERFCSMLGFAQESALQAARASAWDCVYPGDRDRLREAAAQRNGVSESYEISYRVVKKNGDLLWINQYSQHMPDDEGNELIFAYYTDISAQKQLEDTIRADALQHETLINSIPGGVGMYRWDKTFTPIFMSSRVYELCGMTKAEYDEATRTSTLDVFHPDDRQGLIDAVREAYGSNQKFDYTHRVRQKSGGYRWMRVSGQVMPGPDGVPILYTVFTDVHEQK